MYTRSRCERGRDLRDPAVRGRGHWSRARDQRLERRPWGDLRPRDHVQLQQLRKNAARIQTRHPREREEILKAQRPVDLRKHEPGAVIEIESDNLIGSDRHPCNRLERTNPEFVLKLKRRFSSFPQLFQLGMIAS